MHTLLTRLRLLYWDTNGQGVAEYAIMLAVVLTLALGTVHAIGSHADEVFRLVASKIQ
jgi:hypothetical protein